MNAFTITSRVLLMTSVVNSTLNLWAQATGARGPAQPSTPPKTQLQRSTASSIGWRARQGQYYQRVSSGEMLAFRYVVLDPEKAQAFNDKRNSAYLIDEKTGAKLTVPQMEKVGALRTTTTPQPGRMYWMVFANTSRIVDAGARVDVVIGDVHIEGLTVEAK